MAETKDAKASFRIDIDGNAAKSTGDVASSAKLAAKAITAYENEIKTLSADMRRLKGNTDEIKAAKEALKKRIDQAKTSVSSLTTELTKQGVSYGKAADALKKYGEGVARLPNLRSGLAKAFGATKDAAAKPAAKVAAAFAPVAKKVSAAVAPVGKKLGAALAPIGAKLAPIGQRVAKLGGGIGKFARAAAEDLRSIAPSSGTLLKGAKLLGTGLTAAAAAAVALGAAVAAGTLAVLKFGLTAADTAAKLQRQRQALLGNADDAARLGDQIQALAGKVPQGVEELNALGVALSKTRLSGKAIVSTMNAVAQATGAVDAEAGAKIQELLTRGQNTGRFQLGLRELQGTGIDFDDVAREYAAGTKKTIAAARSELAWGKVPLEQGADALAKATEKKFGALNIANAFSLENAPKKFFDQISSLAKGVDLAPITKGLQDAFAQLSPNAPLGASIKTFFETVGSGFADLVGKSIPLVLEGFKYLVAAALQLAASYYETKADILEAWNGSNWIDLGAAIVKGIAKGIKMISGAVLFDGAMTDLAEGIKKAFTGRLDIHSPSRVFAKYGEYTTEGYAQGVESGSRRASSSVLDMLDTSAGGAGARPIAGASSGHESVVVNLHIGSGADAQEVAQTLQSTGTLSALARAVRDALRTGGADVELAKGVA